MAAAPSRHGQRFQPCTRVSALIDRGSTEPDAGRELMPQ